MTPPNYITLRDELRTVWLGQKALHDRAVKGEIKRPAVTIDRYRQIMDAIGAIGSELNVIAANAESYREWKRSIGAQP